MPAADHVHGENPVAEAVEMTEFVEGGTHVRTQLAGWLAAAAAIAYISRNSITVAESTIRRDLDISEDLMGLIMGPAFFWSYALAQIPGGLAGQRFGTRRCLAIFSALSSAASAMFGIATGTVMLLVGRLAGGIGQAGLFPCSALCVSRWFPRSERALASGSLGAAMSVGGAIGAALTGVLMGWFSWRLIFVLYAIPGLAWSVWFYRWFRERPSDHPRVNDAERALIHGGLVDHDDSDGRVMNGSVRRRSNASYWTLTMICGQQFFRASGYAFFASWFATYLQETRDVSTAGSGWLLTLPLLATVVASLVAGRVSDRLLMRTGSLRLARSGLASVALLFCSLLVFMSWHVDSAALATAVIAAGAFCAAFAGPCAYAVTIDVGGNNVATVFGAMNMVGNFGAGLLPWVVPAFRRFVDQSPRLLDGAQGNSWNAVLVLFAVMYLLAAVCWIVMPVRDSEPS